jgi:hypothetical protein
MPEESFAVGFQYTSEDLESGETILSATVTATSGLTVGLPAIVDTTVKVRVSGGTAGVFYTITFKIVTSAGNTYVDELFVKIL